MKARRLLVDGTYERLRPPSEDPKAAVRSQQRFMELARGRVAGVALAPPSPSGQVVPAGASEAGAARNPPGAHAPARASSSAGLAS